MRFENFAKRFDQVFTWIEGKPSEEEEYISYFLRRGTLNVVLVGAIIGTTFMLLIAWLNT